MSKRKTWRLAKKIDERYKYAWDWFSYHAAQRLIAFRYFLLIIGAISLGYLKCHENEWFLLTLIVCCFGMGVSVAFLCLEIRNEELVNCGRGALEKLEKKMGLQIRKDDVDRKYLRKSLTGLVYFRKGKDSKKSKKPKEIAKWIKNLTRHKFWLRVIYIAGFVFFFFLLLNELGVFGSILN